MSLGAQRPPVARIRRRTDIGRKCIRHYRRTRCDSRHLGDRRRLVLQCRLVAVHWAALSGPRSHLAPWLRRRQVPIRGDTDGRRREAHYNKVSEPGTAESPLTPPSTSGIVCPSTVDNLYLTDVTHNPVTRRTPDPGSCSGSSSVPGFSGRIRPSRAPMVPCTSALHIQPTSTAQHEQKHANRTIRHFQVPAIAGTHGDYASNCDRPFPNARCFTKLSGADARTGFRSDRRDVRRHQPG